ncbi:MAG: glycosyltransferase [Candidatus Cloacimonetes bacterium]|nr:glycosyltransferase [Candidatus Cloacimonadota bacterium]
MFYCYSFIVVVFSIFLGIYLYYQNRFKKSFFIEEYFDYIVTNKALSTQPCEKERTLQPKISIIVCARNEEKNIKYLLEALLKQEYDFSHVEILVANDQSTDETEMILEQYCQKHDFIKSFIVKNRENVRSPKKNALKQAIELSKGDIILLTDADCEPSRNWIKSHVMMYERYPETEMVVGFAKTKIIYDDQSPHIPLRIRKQKTVSLFEHIDFLILMYAAQGAIQAGHPFSCSGQNLSYKRSSFYAVDGFDKIDQYVSGDDLLLMQKFVKNGKIIKFAAFRDAFTETNPIVSWKALINQRARWASNLKAMYNMNIKFFIYLLSCFFCMGLMPFFVFFLYLFKVFMDTRFINYIEKTTYHTQPPHANEDNCPLPLSISVLAFWYIICPFYILTVSVLGIFSFFKWKDRR